MRVLFAGFLLLWLWLLFLLLLIVVCWRKRQQEAAFEGAKRESERKRATLSM